MFFASNNRRSKRSRSASTGYVSLEGRQLLTFVPLPTVITTDVAEFSAAVDNAVVRVDDQRRLIIRTTGQENRIDVQLEYGILQVNRADFFDTALEIDTQQYDRILLISGGDDDVRVSGRAITAQLHPDRLWVSAQSHPLDSESGAIQIHGSDFEHVEVNHADIRDFGPFILHSDNRIRFHGSDGVDRLDMGSTSNFSVKTSASLTGDGYYFFANAFEDLYVDGGGGEDFASLAGTRGFQPDSFIANSNEGSSGADLYIGRDNWSRISNELWDGRFVNFETQRVDLLSGEDRSIVEDTVRESAHYRLVGEDLVGAYRRMVGVEFIEIKGSVSGTEVLVQPPSADAVLTQEEDTFILTSQAEAVVPLVPQLNNVFSSRLADNVPNFFQWKFESFDRLA